MKKKSHKKPIHYQYLRKKILPRELHFNTTDELPTLTTFIGQERALEAVNFGVGIKNQRYNIFAMGPSGVGKRSLVTSILEKESAKEKPPSDWCYLHHFAKPGQPIAIKLPAGVGAHFQKDMQKFVEEMGNTILAVFESDEYQKGMAKIQREFNKKRKQKNSPGNKKKAHTVPRLYKERHQQEKTLQRQLARSIIEPMINVLEKKYQALTDILNYLQAVKEDIISHVNEFIKADEISNTLNFDLEHFRLTYYQVNLIVNNENQRGAPVIFEDNPSYANLICSIEHNTQQGACTTNFTLIKAGSLLKANGGYLIVEARKLKKNHDAWDALKRALYTTKLKIASQDSVYEEAKMVSIDPMPIPLNVKVILLGERHVYYTMIDNDPDFAQLFKVAVDFDEWISRDKKNIQLYARLVATIIKREKLKPFSKKGVCALIEHGSRVTEDCEKISTLIRELNDLIIEANFWANKKSKSIVDDEDVAHAIKQQIYRLDRTRELYYEDICRDFVIIATKKRIVGQINALSVIRYGKFSYGHPTRITATVRMGKNKIIDIQREIKMAGSSYAKASLIISHFLAWRYSPHMTLSLCASFVFEQIYGRLDGDSASVAEVSVLLSALSDIPIKQNLAVTGSMDQYGNVQAVGGVNEKIEGFFDICKMKGLTGDQGVLIPTINLKNLMLREDVVLAVKQKKFFVYAIDHIDDAIELLMGMSAGKRTNGSFAKNSVNDKVEKKLLSFTESYYLERDRFRNKKMK